MASEDLLREKTVELACYSLLVRETLSCRCCLSFPQLWKWIAVQEENKPIVLKYYTVFRGRVKFT